ncbi:MAG: transcriptional regulator FilR1 domain-containing protein [bacterium]
MRRSLKSDSDGGSGSLPVEPGRLADAAGLAQELFARGRLAIAQSLQDGPLRYTDIAHRAGGTESEVSRNLARLVESGLVTKGQDGLFRLAGVSNAALTHAESLEFLARHSSFFQAHPIESLPRPFLANLHVLGKAQLLSDPFEIGAVFGRLTETIDSRFYGQWIIGAPGPTGDQIRLNALIAERVKTSRADARAILLESELALVLKAFPKRFGPVFKTRLLQRGPVAIAVTDGLAILQFESAAGQIDFRNAFVGGDPAFVAWCRDLFLHYWDEARPIDET